MKKVDREIHACRCRVCESGIDPVTQAAHRQMNGVLSKLNEAQRRWYVGSLSQQPGGPSDRTLMRITGLDAKTIRRGRRELSNGVAQPLGMRQRPPGVGGPKLKKRQSLNRGALATGGSVHCR